jgi:phosphonate transport system substrate-binding protein
MKALISILLLTTLNLMSSDKLVFGAISTVEPELMKKHLTPFMDYIQKTTGKKVVFKTGYNYQDTIEKLAKQEFDFGYIGPAPYIKAKDINPDSINILAKLKNSPDSPFNSVIISKKGSNIKTLENLNGKNFAFGSPRSTLSYYVPMDILIKSNIVNNLKQYNFLGRHDKVAQYVIMGRYSAGAVKNSIAKMYSKYIQVVKTSKPLSDFVIVSSSSLDKKVSKKIKDALLKLKDKKILSSLKGSAIGFEEARDSDYDDLREIINRVESYKKQ